MDLRRSRWILAAGLASIALLAAAARADEPNFAEEQKIDFLQHAKVVASEREKKGTNALHLTLSEGKLTYDASFERFLVLWVFGLVKLLPSAQHNPIRSYPGLLVRGQ